MSGNLSLTIENLGLVRAFDEIAKAAGVTYQDVVRSETQSILTSALKNTRAAKVAAIESFVNSRTRRKVGTKSYNPKWKLPAPIHAEIQKQIKADLKERKDARGLAKKSWQQLAKSLGITVQAPGFVEKANAKGEDYPADATGKEVKSTSEFYVEITNSRTYDRMIFDAIRKAMRGREKFFKRNLKEGVFKKIESIASKYPGLATK